MASQSTMSFRSSSVQVRSFWISWEVRNPSKKWMTPMLAWMADRWATGARSMTSWGLPEASMAMPVPRQAITSWWSPKMDRAWVVRVRAATWNTPGSPSPAIL